MKSIVVLLLSFVFAAAVAPAADVALQSFQARSLGRSVSVEWRSGVESGVMRYEIERSGSDGIFRFVAAIDAKGTGQNYQFTDDEAFGKRDEQSVIASNLTYRLRVVREDKSLSYSNTVVVTHSVSGIKRTWGMIKEMFR
jgi:opacity protein-like surface antigen